MNIYLDSNMSWLVFAFASAIFAALVAIFAKIGMEGVDSNVATLFRTFIIVPFIAGIVWLQGNLSQLTNFSTKTYIFLLLSGIATGLSWLFYFKSLQMAPIHKVVPIDKLSLPLSIILGLVIFKENISHYGWIGFGMLIAGTYLMVFR